MRKCLLVCAVFGLTYIPTQAAVMQWAAALTPGQETGTVNLPNGENPSGFGTVSFDDMTNVLEANLQWTGLTGSAMQAHIHCCAANVNSNAGIAVDLWLMDNMQPASGSFSRTWDLDTDDPFRANFRPGLTVMEKWEVLRSAFDREEGIAYFNIHTQLNPAGEIRGNIVPEPSTWILMASAFGALAVRRFRKAG